MSELYERYREALLRGHLAARRGEPEIALTCYEEAAAVAPDRPLPHSAQGAILLQLGRARDAEHAFAAALERAPADHGSLAGRGEALARIGRPSEAAATLDRLAGSLLAGGEMVEALDVARHALELAESKARRRQVERLADEIRTSMPAAVGRAALARAAATLAVPPKPSIAAPSPHRPAVEPGATVDAAAAAAAAAATATAPVPTVGAAAGADAVTPTVPDAAGAAPKRRRRRSRPMRWVEVEGGTGGSFVDEEVEDELDDEAGAAPEPEPVAAVAETVVAPEPEPVVAEPEPETVAASEPVEAPASFPGLDREPVAWDAAPEPETVVAPEPVEAPASFPGLDREPVAWDDAPVAAPEPTTAPAPAPAPVVAPRPEPVAAEPAAATAIPTPVATGGVGAAQALLDETDAALAAGDTGRARLLLIDLARAHVAAGRRDAALDACYRALAIAPDDLTLHLLLVQLYLENGWRDLAAEKVELLERLTELDGDETALTLVRSARRVVAGKRQAG
ncbi:MAG: Tetratricopeptide repeat [Chloroflexota bacterium]